MAEVWVRESRMFLSGSLRYNDKIANTYSKKLKSFKSTSMSPYLSHAINQMILDLFMIMCECMQHLSPIFFIWKKRTPMTYRAYVYQFNKHLLTNHNKGIVLLIGLRNWRPTWANEIHVQFSFEQDTLVTENYPTWQITESCNAYSLISW